jgi:hypothetical protein
MRTTLTLDDDVAVQIETLRQSRRVSLKTVINDTLRRGLAEATTARRDPKELFRTRSFDVGEALIPIDNIAEALAVAEGEDFS